MAGPFVASTVSLCLVSALEHCSEQPSRFAGNEDFHRERMLRVRREAEHNDSTAAMLSSLETRRADEERRRRLLKEQHDSEQAALEGVLRRRNYE